MNMCISTTLAHFKHMNIKPNFSELARQLGIDRHTLKKHFDAGEIGQLCGVEFDTFATCIKIVSKNASEPIIAKKPISNLFLDTYKLFLYKKRIKAVIEAHRYNGLVAVWGGGSKNLDTIVEKRAANFLRMIIKQSRIIYLLSYSHLILLNVLTMLTHYCII